MKGFLARMMPAKLAEIEALKTVMPLPAVKALPCPPRASFRDAIGGAGISHVGRELSLIAEIKPSSPSAGTLSTRGDFSQVANLYSRYASAISVLTDTAFFGGSFDLLSRVAGRTDLPLLCKDFVVDEYQVYRARAAGASAVLLIVRILDDHRLGYLHSLILSCDMTPVVEVQNEDDLDRANRINAKTILINNRDLETLAIALETTGRLAARVPDEVTLIAASGITTVEDLRSLLPFASCFLIGSALMQSANPEQLLAEFKAAGKSCAAIEMTPGVRR